MWSNRPTHKKSQQTRNPDMAAIKQLDQIIGEAIHYEHQLEEIANIIGSVDHINDDYQPINDIEEAFITALVYAEIRAEQIVEIIHPQDFHCEAQPKLVEDVDNHDHYFRAINDVRLYLQNTDVNEITIEDIEAAITKGFQPCGL